MKVRNCTQYVSISTPVGDEVIMWGMLILIPLVSIGGIFGNVFSYIILKESSGKISSFFYIRCLTIFDCLSLIFTLFEFYTVSVLHPLFVRYRFYASMDSIWIRWGVCQFTTYLAFTSRTLSVWTISIFTMERSIGIKFPILSLKLSTIRVAKIVIAILVVSAFLSNIHWIFSYNYKLSRCYNVPICKTNKFMLNFRIVDFVMISIVPSIIIIIFNLIIIISLRQRRKLNLVAQEKSGYKKRDKKITIQLMIVSFVFIALTIPSCISTIINTVQEWHKNKSYRKGALANFYHISMLFFTLNLATNFLLYCFAGKNFRYAAYSLLCCNLRKMRKYRGALFETLTENKPGTLQSSTLRDTEAENDDVMMSNMSTKPLRGGKNRKN